MKSLISLINLLLLTAVFSLLLTSSVIAENQKKTEIYKWVDENGRIHYAARPGSDSAQKMHFGSKIFHETSTKENKDKARNSERDKLCKDSKETLKKYKKAPFLYRYDEELKQRVRLTKAENKETFLQAEKDVSYWCNPPPTPSTNTDKEDK